VDVAGNHVEVSAGGGNGVMMVYVDRGAGAQGPYDTKNNTVHDNSIVHLGGGSDGFGIYFNPALASTWTNTWDHNTYTVADANHPYWRFGTTDYSWQQLRQRTKFEDSGSLTTASDRSRRGEFDALAQVLAAHGSLLVDANAYIRCPEQ
jgi:hypothetical protein